MRYNPDLHHRRSIRLRGYDYANAGAYFVTVCLNQRVPVVARLLNDIAEPLNYVAGQPRRVAPTFGTVDDEFLVTPNHVCGIIELD